MTKEKWTSAAGYTARIIVGKIGEGVDLIEGIFGIAKEYGITSGTVTAIGSLNAATVKCPTSTDVKRSLDETMIAYPMEGPVELGIGRGVFGTDANGEMHIHFHALAMDKDGNMRCGNLQPGSAPVMAIVDLTIEEYQGLEIKPIYHPVRKNTRLIPVSLASSIPPIPGRTKPKKVENKGKNAIMGAGSD